MSPGPGKKEQAMYKTKIWDETDNTNFNWERYFSLESTSFNEIIEKIDAPQMICDLRKILEENKFLMAVTLNKVLRRLLKGVEIKQNPRILELGVATGFLTRYLIDRYGGSGVLVDNSHSAYKAYLSTQDNNKKYITYILQDLFKLKLEETFDLVCSFGLIEHFIDKRGVVAAHKKFLAPQGVIIVLVPLDTSLSRVFLEMHPELNVGYRELLTEKELRDLLTQNQLQVIGTQVSSGYSYDFAGAVCRTK
jgi:SAM-dependent methyltransferase